MVTSIPLRKRVGYDLPTTDQPHLPGVPLCWRFSHRWICARRTILKRPVYRLLYWINEITGVSLSLGLLRVPDRRVWCGIGTADVLAVNDTVLLWACALYQLRCLDAGGQVSPLRCPLSGGWDQ